MNTPLLSINDLSVHFNIKHNLTLKAVNGVSLDFFQKETIGVVGESGCGKTTLGKTIVQLIRPTKGGIKFNNENLSQISKERRRRLKKNIQIIFQDPYSSLNPRLSIGSIVSEPMKNFNMYDKSGIRKKTSEILDLVGINPKYSDRYPHEFSGGQRQRISIARALSVEPDFIVCDEPVSALDVSIQAQILNLLIILQEKFSLTYLFISHDLSVTKHISDKIAVMYLGEIVELGSSNSITEKPLHPYAKALISAVPIPDPSIERERERIILTGELPSPIKIPEGCAFSSRCPHVMEKCHRIKPVLKKLDNDRICACHLY